MSTLRFASQTKNIKNKPIINEDSKDALLRKFQEQVRDLQLQLADEEGISVKSNLSMRISTITSIVLLI